MKIIGITPEPFLEGEVFAYNRLFEEGLEILHLRKPAATSSELSQLLDAISPEYYGRIVLHDHYSLANQYQLRGIHLNARNETSFRGKPVRLSLSRSCHSFQELRHASVFNYVFLSPIFNSISKLGYQAAFPRKDLLQARDEGIINSSVIALGGVTPVRVPDAESLGFGGVAVLGALWSNFRYERDTDMVLRRFDKFKKYI